MRFALSIVLVLVACMHSNDAQFNGMGRFFGNFGHMFNMFRPFQAMFNGFQRPAAQSTSANGVSGGTSSPQVPILRISVSAGKVYGLISVLQWWTELPQKVTDEIQLRNSPSFRFDATWVAATKKLSTNIHM
jgi:hypothetical protein